MTSVRKYFFGRQFVLFFIFLFTIFFDLSAQENREIDSLTRQLDKKNLTDSTRMELLSMLAYAYQTISPAKSFEYIKKWC